jgi:hydrogenase expression/formation protein HypD
MNFNEDFRNKFLIDKLISEIHKIAIRPVRIMEVCGGHTMAIRRFGIHSLLPSQIELLSGPGCPVCVTSQHFIDLVITYAQQQDIILLTYGDLLRVPGSYSSLERERAFKSDVRIIYSTIQALEIARQNPGKKVVFAAIGFETTVPGTALSIKQAQQEGITNFYILCAHKTMPEAMAALIDEGIQIDGYIGPGHVCAVAGSKIFTPIAEKYHIPIVISGFEPLDLVQSTLMLINMISENHWGVDIQYNRLVTKMGNTKAQLLIDEVFEPCSDAWRGIGIIKNSGLRIRKEYEQYDAQKCIPLEVKTGPEPKGCLCGNVLKGISKPTDCSLFGKNCTPAHPVGACMVSSEGSCQAYFNYQNYSSI